MISISKRGVLGVSLIGLIVVSLFVYIIFFSTPSSAFLKKDIYRLGESIKLDLGSATDYKIKINTPTQTFVKYGSKDLFIYKLDEEGNYTIEVRYGDILEQHVFQVISSSIPIESVEPNLIEQPELSNKLIRSSTSIRINEPARFVEEIDLDNGENSVSIPLIATNVSVRSLDSEVMLELPFEEHENIISNFLTNVFTSSSELPTKDIVVSQGSGKAQVTYFTEAPIASETQISNNEKEIKVYSPSELHYLNVIAYTNLTGFNISQGTIRVYWKEEQRYLSLVAKDTDNDGLIDYVEWVVPHLSEQTFQIIYINSAEHLDSNRHLVENVYPQVSERDDLFTSIPDSHYLRVVFDELLTSHNDITIYAKSQDSNAHVLVYGKDSDVLLADYGEISQDKEYKIILSNLIGVQDTFDLFVNGGTVDFDYVVDPAVVYVYDYVGVNRTAGTHKAYDVDLDNWPPNDGVGTINGNTNIFTELTNTNYTNLNSSNNVRGQINDPGAGDEPMLWLNMHVNQTRTKITQMKFLFEGFPASAGTVEMYLFNATADAWDTTTLASAAFGTSDQVLTGTLSSGFTDYVNSSGDILWGIYSTVSSDVLQFDFVQMNVTYTYNVPTTPVTKINSSNGLNSTNSPLLCYDNISDPDADRLNVSVRWFTYGILNFTFDYNNSYANNTLFIANLSSGNLSVGQNWSCSIRLFDGENYTSYVNSSNITIIGSSVPTIGVNIGNITWGINQTIIYYLNFTNTGTSTGSFSVNLTNGSNARFVTANQTTFSNILAGSTAYFQINLSSPNPGFYDVIVNVTSITGTANRDSIRLNTTILALAQMAFGNITSVSVTPFGYSKLITAWCDETLDKTSFGIYDTNGTLLKPVYDVDTTSGSCTANGVGYSVSVSAFDDTKFVVAWYDSVDADITFEVFNSSLSNLTQIIDVDTNAGASAAVSTSAFNSSGFVIGWFDAVSGNDSFATYTNNGSLITPKTRVGTSTALAGNSIDVAAINSTAFMFAFFDDTANDISSQTFSIYGTALSAVFDVDTGAGQSESASISVINSSTAVLAWFDIGGAGAGSQDASFQTITTSSTVISATIDVDLTVGTTGRPTRVTSISQTEFAYSWFDSDVDIGIFAQTFGENTVNSSNEITVQSSSQPTNDIASEEYSTGIQFCKDSYVVAFSNSTASAFWKAYYPNGTAWGGVCPIIYPQILNLQVSAIGAFSAFVNWSTDIDANSTINYGTTLALGTIQGNSIGKTIHSFNLTGLSPQITYFYNVTSCADGLCNSTGVFNFTTVLGDTQPQIGQPIDSQTWTVNTNAKYIINFTNNGTVYSNYSINITNLTGATYAYLNQTTFLNIPNGSISYFEVNLSGSTQGVYNLSVNITSLLDSTKKDSVIFSTTFLQLGGISLNSVTSIAITPFDYNRVIAVWCDDDLNQILLGVYNATGSLLQRVTVVDSTAGACTANTAGHSVSVSAFNTSQFVVGWYDSVSADVTFKIYNSSLANMTNDIDADTSAGTSLAVSTSALNSTAFVIGWYDQASTRASAATYSSSGTTLTAQFDVDANVGANAQAIEVSAINSTTFATAYFDDSGGGGGINTIFYGSFSFTGTSMFTPVTVDSTAGNARSASIAVMNESSVVLSWPDFAGLVNSFAVYYLNGTVRVAQTTIDTDSTGGEDVRVSANTQDDFVVSWYDPTTDIGAYAQVYINNGTNTSRQNLVQNNSQQYNDVASEEYSTQIQLCENAYAVAVVNSTSSSFWKAYYPNGTAWGGVCPTYVPQILNVNVSNITITSAKINWSTNVEANGSISYGTTLALGTLLGTNFPSLLHTFQLNNLVGGTLYYFNVTSCIDGRCNSTGVFNFTTAGADTVPPTIALVFPLNNSNITDSFGYTFVFNVSDTSNVDNCTLYINGTAVEFMNSISQGINQTFYHYLNNGTYTWAVSCADQFNNTNSTVNRTVNVRVPFMTSFGKRFYETYPGNFSTNNTALIWINGSQDSLQNTVTFNIPTLTNVNLVNATSPVMGANGALIPGGSIVDFSTSFSLANANVLLTWKVYIANSSGNTLLCQNGDDSSGGTAVAGTTTGQNTTCINQNIRLRQSDRIFYVIDAYNSNAGIGASITHAWDSPTSSYLDLNITTEGFLLSNLTYPTSMLNKTQGDIFNVTCNAFCTVGTCRNTIAYLQFNTSATGWQNVSSSGNLILAGTETNPHSLGNITSTTTTSFNVSGTIRSTDNVRCYVASDYDYNITPTQIIGILGIPQFTFTSPTLATGSTVGATSYPLNLSVIEPLLSQFIWSWNGVNYTLYNSELKLSYDFNNLSALGENSTIIFDNSLSKINGTALNGAFYNISGKYGGAYQFDGVNDTINISTGASLDFGVIEPFTFAFWLRTNDTVGMAISFRNASNVNPAIDIGVGYNGSTTVPGNITFFVRNNTGGTPASGYGKWIADNNWHHIALTRNSSGTIQLFVDAISQINMTTAGSRGSITSTHRSLGTELRWIQDGLGTNDQRFLNGSIDSLRIWNRTLSQIEISQLQMIDFAKLNQSTWFLYANETGLTNGVYTYYGNATNLEGINNQSETRNITVDTSAIVPPVITIISPISQLYNVSTIQFNVSLDRAGSWCGYSLDSATNVSMTAFNSTYFYLSVSSISQENHTVMFSCNSTTGYMNTTSPVLFSVDTLNPVLAFVSPTPANAVTLTQNNFSVNITIFDNTLRSFIWSWNFTNFTIINSSLVVGYNFENLSSLNENNSIVKDFSQYSNNATLNGSMIWNATGRYGGAYLFDGVNDFALLDRPPALSSNGNWTYAFWVYPNNYSNGTTSDALGTYFIDRNATTNAIVSVKAVSGGYALQTRYDDGSGIGAVTATGSIKLNTWTYVVVTREVGSAFRIYINGQLNNSGADTGAALTPPRTKIGGQATACPGSGCFNGTLDEFRIWSRAFSATEVNESYLSNIVRLNNSAWNFFANKTQLLDANYSFIGYSTDAVNLTGTTGVRNLRINTATNIPSIQLNLPLNASNLNSSSVIFNFTVLDKLDTSLICNLTAGTKQDLNFVAANGTSTARTLNGFVDGVHLWNVTCLNSLGSQNSSVTWMVNITEKPTITLNTANATYFTTTVFNLTYTPTDNTNFSICDLYLDGIYNQSNSSTIINGQRNNFTVQNISESIHTWYVSCNDTINLNNISQTRTFTVDTDGIAIALRGPPSGSSLFSSPIFFAYNVTDNLDPQLLCNITIDDSVVNTSFATNGNLTNISVSYTTGGTHFWNITCIDDAGNRENSTTWNFSLESSPSVALSSPAANSFFNVSNVTLVYNVLDANDNLANATLIINGVKNITNQSTIINGDVNSFTLNLSDGFYNWTVNVTDFTNLVGTDNITRNFTIDTHSPLILLSGPLNGTTVDWNNISLNFTATDNIDSVLTCNLTIDGAVSLANFNAQNGTLVNKNVIKADGNYLWSVTCIDDAGNKNSSQIWNFTVEAPPRVTLLNPPNNLFINATSYSFVYLPSDAIGLFSCSVYLDNLLNQSSSSITSDVNNSFTINGMSEGFHNWTVSCTDVFPDFNVYTPNSTNFTVDVTFPTITLNLPYNGSNTLRTVDFNFTGIDNIDQNLSCNLYINGTLNVSSIITPNNTATIQTVTRLAVGAHTWNVSCVDDAGNRNWSVLFNFNTTLAELTLNSSDIVFNMTSPTENDTVHINATIYNSINVTVKNITVSFFEGNPITGGRQIGANQTIVQLDGITNATVGIDWFASLGTSQIYVHIDPPINSNGSIEEWNETNNVANNSATVIAWEFVYGSLSSTSYLTLADLENQSVINWNATTFNNGRLYVSDSESQVSWTKLAALGHNKSGSNTTNDFNDTDILLNMSNFKDSITQFFSNGTRPTNVTSLYLFNTLITEIPIANSTNSTTFYTGIVWDTSDDVGDGEYSQDDKEDLIFFTKLNHNVQGAYGVYDYEMRIPAKLREYYTAESRGVTFYTELF